MTTKGTAASYSPEGRVRAVRLVLERGGEHPTQRAAITLVASKIGCTSETLRSWVRQAERDVAETRSVCGWGAAWADNGRARADQGFGARGARVAANEVLRKAGAFFAQAELDYPFKR